MSKPIKLLKDRLGKAYYPATTTDAVIHPTIKQSVTDIIDNLSIEVEDGSVTMQKLSSDVQEAINKEIPDNYITEDILTSKKYATETFVNTKIAEAELNNKDIDLSSKQDVINDLDSIRTNAGNGNVAYGWGDHSKAGYLTEHQSLDSKQDVISDLATIRSNAEKGATALQSVPDEYVTETELSGKGYATTTQLNAKQDTISDLATIRTNASNGATAYNWGNHANAGYLKTVPSEYITETELTDKGYLTSASIPTKTSQLTNDSGFITQLKTIMNQSLIGTGNIDFTEAITKAVNTTNIESIKFKGILNVWSDFTKLKSLTDSINVGEVFFCLPSLNDDVMGCMPKETSWRDLAIPASLSNAVDDVEKYVEECTGGVETLSPINIHGARAMYPSDVFKLGGSFLENLSAVSAINKLGYYPMLLTLDQDVWKTMSFREGDMFCMAKMDYSIASGIEVPVVLCFTWQIGSANANKYAGYNTLIHRWAPSTNQCLKTGVYPWVTQNVPVANNAYTLFVESSTNRDDNGYYTIKQTAYGRQSDTEIYERMVVAKQSYLNYYVPSVNSAISQLKDTTKLTCEWAPSDYVCIAYYSSENKLTHWDVHIIQDMVNNTTAIINEDNTIQFSSDFCKTVEGKVSLCIVNSVTPGPNGRLYPVSYKSTKVGSTQTSMATLSILGDFVENPNTPWKMTSDAFTSRGGGDANWCLDSGVYPWVVVNVPTGNDGAFTLVVHKTASPDGGGYYTIDQTAYGRQGEETMYVYKRLLFYKPATPGTDEVDILENGAAWHKINNSNSGGLNITTENGLLSNIKIGYEPGTNVNSIAAQPGSHHCIVDENGTKGIGYANIDIVSHWNNTHTVTITVVSNHGGITTTYVASAVDIPNDVVRVPGFNNITTWATTNTRSDYINKTAIIPNVTSNRVNPEYLTQVEFINKHGFNPANYTLQNDKFMAMTEIGVVQTPTYITGYGLCEIELLTKEYEEETKYALVLSFEKLNIKTSNEIATGVYTDAQLKNMFGYTFSYLGDTIIARDKVYHASELTSYKKVYTRITESGVINVVSIVFENDKYTIQTTAFNIQS